MKKLLTCFVLLFCCSLSLSMLQACISDRKETPIPVSVSSNETPCPYNAATKQYVCE